MSSHQISIISGQRKALSTNVANGDMLICCQARVNGEWRCAGCRFLWPSISWSWWYYGIAVRTSWSKCQPPRSVLPTCPSRTPLLRLNHDTLDKRLSYTCLDFSVIPNEMENNGVSLHQSNEYWYWTIGRTSITAVHANSFHALATVSFAIARLCSMVVRACCRLHMAERVFDAGPMLWCATCFGLLLGWYCRIMVTLGVNAAMASRGIPGLKWIIVGWVVNPTFPVGSCLVCAWCIASNFFKAANCLYPSILFVFSNSWACLRVQQRDPWCIYVRTILWLTCIE